MTDSAAVDAAVPADRGVVYASFIDAAVREEQDRTQILDRRARGVQQTSTTGLGLVAAGGALLLGGAFTLSFWARVVFALALAALMVGVVFAAISARPKAYATTHVDTLRDMVDGQWADAEPAARRACAALQVDTVESLREGNNTKVSWVETAVWAQTAGLVLLGATLTLAAFGA